MISVLKRINGIVWGAPALLLILGVGLYLTVRTGGVQLRLFPRACKQFFRRSDDREGISSFQALCTALAATVGTGNLAGVAGAMALGGPGAIFWMWCCGLLGMVIKFAEAALSVRFREKAPNGTWLCGPMYMIRRGMGQRWAWLGSLYCFFGIAAAFGVGNATQVSAVMDGVGQAFNAFGGSLSNRGRLLLGLLLAVLVTAALLGGAKRIGKVAELLVPFAAGGYLLLGLMFLVLRADALPNALNMIVQGAFSPRAATGGMVGSAFLTLRIGISRGVFTNEAGMGTAAMAHGAANVQPVEQGMMGILEVFLDTLVICTVTALVILCSGVEIPYGTDPGAILTTQAFASVYGDWATVFIAGALACFAFATLLGWGLYGARCAQYLLGGNAWRRFALLQGGIIVLSTLLQTETAWLLSELFNGLMAIPNLIALASLTPELVRMLKQSGGTYENIHQRQPLRTLSHAEIPSAGPIRGKAGQKDLSPEHRPAGSGNPAGISGGGA